MKIELDKDPLFTKKQTFVEMLKAQQLEKRRQNKILKTSTQPIEINVQVIDPLPAELRKYRHKITYKQGYESNKPSDSLKKYITQQQRNLKYLRLERIATEPNQSSSRIKLNFSPSKKTDLSKSMTQQDEGPKQSDIPIIQDFFKNQQLQNMLHQSKQLSLSLSHASKLIDSGLKNPKLALQQSINTIKSDLPSIPLNTKPTPTMSDQTISTDFQQIQIDKIIQKRHRMNVRLIQKLNRYKRQLSLQHNDQKNNNNNNDNKSTSDAKTDNKTNFIIHKIPKQKKKVILKGIKSVSCMDGNQKIKVYPASKLLFQLHNLTKGISKKDKELDDIVQNSYNNREEILQEKQEFYQKQTPLNDLSVSNQYKLRNLMDKRLSRRLELSKQQINHFVKYLYDIKQYHQIINKTILQVLREVREILLTGKIMKRSDLDSIIYSIGIMGRKQGLQGYPNQLIINNLYNMMI